MEITVKDSEAEPGVGFRVVHDGIAYLPGETADVPDEVAREWAASGWIEPLKFDTQPPELEKAQPNSKR
jgi:hypothetical protein